MDGFTLKISVCLTVLLALSNTVKSVPVTTTTPNISEEETVAVYVPYDVKFIPVEIPNNSTNGLSVASLNSTSQETANNQSSSQEDYVLVSLSALSQLNLREVIPATPKVVHKIAKRQTRRYPFYRPVFRFSRFSTGRRRTGGSFGRYGHAVGYLNDRDYFPTVA